MARHTARHSTCSVVTADSSPYVELVEELHSITTVQMLCPQYTPDLCSIVGLMDWVNF